MTRASSSNGWFSFARWWAMVGKEFLQLRRDRVTFAMIVGIPIIQLVLFGYAINADPKHMPTAILAYDHSEFTRSFVAAMQVSDYFHVVGELPDEAAGRRALAVGTAQFVLTIPAGFTTSLLRGERPQLLLEADASDPTATGAAIAATTGLIAAVAAKELVGPYAALAGAPPPFDVAVHRKFNPESITQYNIVPGLMGVILTLTLVMMTGLAITRERERGTMENLLAMPISPLEVMTGKIVPYIAIGLIQATIIVVAAQPVEALLSQRLEIGKQLLAAVRPEAEKVGVTVHATEVKDVMFPGELKKVFTEVLKAKQEGQAALERARGESAALRNLANAARLMEDNPALQNLRLLQSITAAGAAGNTLVMGLPAGFVPLSNRKAPTGGGDANKKEAGE